MITYVVPHLHAPGGIQEYAKLVYSELSRNYEMRILDWKPIELNLGTKAILRFFPPKLGHSFFSHSSILEKYRKTYKTIKDADLIHFWHIEPAVPFLNKKYVISCHGLEILPANVRGFRKIMYPKVLDKALRIHANSRYTKTSILSWFGGIENRKIRVIPGTLDYKKFARSRPKVGKKDKIVIGTLGRLVQRKNILNIIRSLNILGEKYRVNFKYYLAGVGPEKKKILAELDKSKFEWRYFGEISEKRKVEEFYPSLDVFVMPTLNLPNDVEGFGIVYLEANAYGVPVVASKAGGVLDAVKQNVSGVFADATNPDDIAIKIKKVLDSKSKYKSSTKKWAKRFDVKRVTKKFMEMYDEVL